MYADVIWSSLHHSARIGTRGTGTKTLDTVAITTAVINKLSFVSDSGPLCLLSMKLLAG